MNYYNLSSEEVLEKLNTKNSGLSIEEAEDRLKENGKNELVGGKSTPAIIKFLNQFKDLMIIVLLLASIFSFVSSLVNNESFIDSIIIIAIVILNAMLGFFQERKADKTLESLKKFQKANIKVKRSNKVYLLESELLVKGDIILLEAGDKVPADARIITSSSLKIDESSLTGESLPVDKNLDVINGEVSLSERYNMIYSGTNVVYGKCEAVVCATGMKTEFGKIASSLNDEEKEITPLQQKIDNISKVLTGLITIIIIIIFIIGILKRMELLEIIMLSISLAVAAIPEGLPAIITIVLSLGMEELAKKKAIVRKMSSVETLGSTEIICTDKTGTITQNKMTVEEIYYDNKLIKSDDIEGFNQLFNIMILNNDATKNQDKYIGDPTEIALYQIVEKYVDINTIRLTNKRIYELPFDSDRKMMSTINQNGDEIKIYTKGSFDSLIERCSYIMINNEIKELTETKKKELKEIENNESTKAYRVLAFAYKKLDSNYKFTKNLESDLIFVGMTSMIDPPRVDAKEAIEICKKASIRPIMITGDSLCTAKAIAHEVGILTDDSEAITGIEIDNMSEEELKDNIGKYSVYARVSPMNKLAIVNAWKEKGKIVAMTGDGVNDAPALKAADIGVGMGITGTEVSKNVSDIILVDDSFSTIVTAVREGRRIFDNIRNTLVYLLAGNIAEVMVVFFGLLFGVEIFLPIQLLYINLITDSIPAIALAFEKESEDVIEREIRKKDSSFFTPFLVSKILLSSFLKGFAILGIFLMFRNLYDVNIATTVAFLTLVLLEMIYAYSCRNLKKNVIFSGLFKNKVLNISMLILVLIQVLVFLTPIRSIFNLTTLTLAQFGYLILMVLLVFLIDEFSKKILSRMFKD